MKWIARLFLIALLLGAAAFTGWRWSKIRDFPKGAGEWVNSPDGTRYAVLYQLVHRPFWGGFRTEWRLEAGDGDIARPSRVWLDEVIPATALPGELSAERFIRWESNDTVVFGLRDGERRVSAKR